MQRATLAIFALSCALSTRVYSQAARPTPAPPPPLHGPERQAAIAAATGKSASAPNASSVGMEQAVITLQGGCVATGGIAPAKDCVSSVTRADFEKLTEALQPNMPADSKRNFATNYAKLLVFVDAARALGLENDPKVKIVMDFVSNQVLAESVKRHFADEYAHPTDQQIQDYYNQNSNKYLEATLQRIIVPRNPGGPDKPKPNEADEKAAAEKVRQQWVDGGDPVKLQQDAYQLAGISAAGPVEVSLGAKRPGSLPPNQESVFQLKAGEVSPVFVDPGALFIYKVVSVQQVPMSDVKDAISKILQQQGLQSKLEEISKSATPVLNEEYFGPASTGAPAMGGRPGASAPAPHSSSPQ